MLPQVESSFASCWSEFITADDAAASAPAAGINGVLASVGRMEEVVEVLSGEGSGSVGVSLA